MTVVRGDKIGIMDIEFGRMLVFVAKRMYFCYSQALYEPFQ